MVHEGQREAYLGAALSQGCSQPTTACQPNRPARAPGGKSAAIRPCSVAADKRRVKAGELASAVGQPGPAALKESSLLEKGEMKTRPSHYQHQAPLLSLCPKTPLKKILQVRGEPELQMRRAVAVRSQCGPALNSWPLVCGHSL